MTRSGKNLLLFFLAVCLFLVSPMTAVYAQDDVPSVVIETYDGETTQQTELTAEEAAALPMPMADVNYYSTLEAAAADVRSQLLVGANPVVVGVNQSYAKTKVKELYALALSHTGNPKEGDYLANHCRGYSASISYTGSSFVVTYTPGYATTAQQEAQVDTKVSQILASIRRDTPYHSILDIFRWLRGNVEYQSGGTIKHTAYSALIEGQGVCESYAGAFYRLALECGIDCRIVTGYLIDGHHAWNIVKLDGAYYIIDATDDIFLRCPASVEGLLIPDAEFLAEPFVSDCPMTTQDYTANIPYVYDEATATLTLPTTASVIDYYRDVTDLLMEQQLGGIPNPNFKYSTAPWESLMANVTTVKLGGSPSFIPSRMFYWNFNIQSVTVPASVSLIQENAFNSCIGLTDIYFGGTQAQWDSITVEKYNNALGWVRVHPNTRLGVTLSGSYKAFGGAGDSLTIQLIPAGFEDAAYTFTNAAAPEVSGSWSIDGVAAGSYTVLVTKQNHVAREYALTVGDEAAALDVEVWLIGDVTGDGLVNFSDYSKVLSQSKKPNSQILTDYAFLCGDVTGDSAINFADYSKVLSQAKGKGSLWQ